MKTVQHYRLELVADRTVEYRCQSVNNASAAAAIFTELTKRSPVEHMIVLMLNSANEIIGTCTVSMGGIAGAGVSVADILRPAIAAGARSVILGHNHPSGRPEPSADDITMTRAILDACRVVGLELLDHVVVTREGKHESIRGLIDWGEP